MRNRLGAAAVLALSAGFTRAQEIEIVPVRGPVYMLAGAGANITVSVGKDGVFLVDSGRVEMSDKVLAALERLNREVVTGGQPRSTFPPPKPIRYIANTSAAADHSGGNAKIAEAGKTFTGGNVSGEISGAGEGAAILAHENTLHWLTVAKVPGKGLPTETFFGKVMKLSHFFNGEGIQVFHAPAANTDGDTFVYFRGSDVISAGDIFDFARYPMIDLAKGGGVQGIIDGLNHMIDLAVPEFRTEGGTLVIPGHGRVCDLADLAYYRDMMTMIRDRVQDMIRKDMTLAQVKAARPTEDWDGRLGSATGPWTTDMFVEAVYRSLSQTGPQK